VTKPNELELQDSSDSVEEPEDLQDEYDYDEPAPRRTGLALRVVAGVVIALLLVGAGIAGGWLITNSNAPGDDSADAGFARDMAVHHAQAVEMGMYAFRTADDPELQIMGYDIATTQQYQIGMMQSWLTEWHLDLASPPDKVMAWMPDGRRSILPDGRMPGMATNDEIKKLESLKGREFDILFCQLMLRHHLGGVHMADEALTLVKDDRVKELAGQIKQSQQLEITTLSAKLKGYGAQPLQ
jgi:uncharacterized protein (DUF305 family)